MSLVLSQLRWPSLARDLAIMTAPGSPLSDLKDVLDSYNLKEDDLKTLLELPQFRELFKRELDEVKAQGSKASAIYRSATLSQALTEKLFRDAVNNNMESKDALRLLELLLKSSGALTPSEAAVQVQNNIGIAIPVPHGMKNRKLQHLEITGGA